MNFLAHLWLTERAGLPLAGAVLGDVLHGRIERLGLPPDLGRSVAFHRRVDAATDRHPLIVGLRAGFAPGARRYAGIVLDLVCDHCLAADWSRYSTEPLPRFAARAGRQVASEADRFILAGAPAPDADRFARLLTGYALPAGVERGLRAAAARLRDPGALREAARHWPELAATVSPHLCRLLTEVASAAL